MRAKAEIIYRANNCGSEFIKTYNKNRVYVPPHIDRQIQEFYDAVLSAIQDKDVLTLRSEIASLSHGQQYYSQKILSLMHKFIGFK
jgi:hypothetical protein